MNKKSISIALVGLAIILLSVFLYFLFNPVIYKGGIFNKVVHAEYKEKFRLEDQISFVFFAARMTFVLLDQWILKRRDVIM